MTTASTFFFCHLIGKRVLTPEGKIYGRLKDLIADPALARPEIVAAVVAREGGDATLDFSAFSIGAAKGGALTCREARPADLRGRKAISVRALLNKKVVDMHKRGAIPVYDVKIAVQNGKSTLVAVDAGAQGRLRQLGLEGFVRALFKLFDLEISSRLVLWDNVEAFGLDGAEPALSKSLHRLGRLHPSEMADIIEQMDHTTQVALFSAMDVERAADVLEELEPRALEGLVGSLPPDKVAHVLERMPADEAADVLDEVGGARAEALLGAMKREVSGEVRELMAYEDGQVGSLMMTDFIRLHASETAASALRRLREEAPERDALHALYVVSDAGALTATMSLADLALAEPGARVGDIMRRSAAAVLDTDGVESLNEIIAKYSLLAVPVVSAEGILLGTVTISDAFFSLLRARRRRL